jgi:hypothetical protein
MGHRDFKTTLIYADYQPDAAKEADLVERAFALPLQGMKTGAGRQEKGIEQDRPNLEKVPL